MMFSESRNQRRPPIASGIATTPQGSRQRRRDQRWRRRDRRYRCERDPMLNSILNEDWSNSVRGRKIPVSRGAVSDAIVRSWLWLTATRSSPLGYFGNYCKWLIIEPTFCGSRFSTGRLLAIDQSGKVILPTDIDISHMSAKNSEE